MKFWNRLVVGVMALALAFSLGLGTADAQSSKSKKKDAKKKEVKKKEVHKSSPSGPKTYLSGTNTAGRSGLLFSDTSEVADLSKFEGSAHFLFQTFTGGNFMMVPIGGHFGIARNFEVSANIMPTILTFDGGGSGSATLLTLGGKYRIEAKGTANLSFSVGGDVTIPLEGGSAIFVPKGTVSYILESGVLLNGQMGIAFGGSTVVVASAGAGIPFSSDFTGIVEIGANQMTGGLSASALGGGIRLGRDSFKFQAMVGVPLNTVGGGVILGGGIILASN